MKVKLFELTALPEGGAVSFKIQEFSGFAVNKDNRIYAYKNSCPHLGIPLEWQENQFLDAQGELIECSTHGALFLIESGECVSGPCAGDHLEPVAITIDSGVVYAV